MNNSALQHAKTVAFRSGASWRHGKGAEKKFPLLESA
jgi:hypothetical protein